MLKSLRNKIAIPLFCTLICAIGFACGEEGTYYQFKEIKNAEWLQGDTLIFEIDSTEIELNIPYSVSIEITNNNHYPYRNFWCFVEDNIQNDSIYEKTSLEFVLADELGKWNGSGFGALYQSSFSLKEQIRFGENRNYKIKILQGMRDEPLAGIEKIGINIFKSR